MMIAEKQKVTPMGNSKAAQKEGYHCSPTVEEVMEAKTLVRQSRSTNNGIEPGVCAVCRRKLTESHRSVGSLAGVEINFPVYFCDSAEVLLDDAEELENNRKRSQWMRECPPLYRSIKPEHREKYPRIDWDQFDRVMRWRPEMGMNRGIVMIGDSGSGKSTALWHLMFWLGKQGTKWAVYDGGKLSEAFFGAVARSDVMNLTESLVRIPVLALEDFGKGRLEGAISAFIFDVINRRTEQGNPIIMTSRFTSETLPERFRDDRTKGHDIARRLNDYCEPIAFRLGGQK